MLRDQPIQAFIATTDAERSRAFYEQTLGLEFVDDDGFALTFDCHGTTLRMPRVQQAVVAPYTVLGWQVPDVAAAVAELTSRGVAFERYPGMNQDEAGIWTPPGSGAVAWFKDPEGHLLSVSGAS